MKDILIKNSETDDEIKQKAYVGWKSWQEAYADILDQSFLEKLDLERNEALAFYWRDSTIVAKDGDRVIGFAVCGPCRDPDLPEAGEVYAIYILSEYYGQQVGYRLMLAALERLKEHSVVVVWVLKENRRAIRFYRRCGFEFDGAEKVLQLGKPVTEVRMIFTRKEE